MQSSSFFASPRTQVTILFVIVSMLLTACDLVASPESDETTFDGPPEVTIASPLNGDTYQEGIGINILLRVDNAGPDIARIAVEVDGTIIGEAIDPNPNGDASFTVNNGWPATGEGQHVISAVASRTDGTVSEEASVTINVIANEMVMEDEEAPTTIPTPTDVPDNGEIEDSSSDETGSEDTEEQVEAPQVTNTPAATSTPAPINTPARPQVVVRQGANVRSGPGTVFEPPVGSLAAGARANILALNTAGTWYRIEFGLSDAWISDIVVDVEGNLAGLPREAGPPTPVPPSPVPPTNTPVPASNVDLFIDGAQSATSPEFFCLQSSELRMTVVNAGSETSDSTTIIAEDIFNGQVTTSITAPVPALGPNQSHTAVMYLEVSTNVNELHTSRVRVDPNNTINETNESNNSISRDYVLGCN